jgi:glutathione S-transferase
MSLILHMHPLASFCHKVLIALYENDTPFEARIVDGETQAAFKALWPIGKMPVLQDLARDQVIPETTIIIEYLQTWYPGSVRLIPDEPDLALRVRAADRFHDLYVQQPMQKIVTDKLRPEGCNDPHGVDQARQQLAIAYGLIDADLADGRTWATGEAFSLADCAAAPALFYADKIAPLATAHPHAARYLDRLRARPSFSRVLREAEPWFAMFPG